MSGGDYDLQDLERRMRGAVTVLKSEFAGLRTGRASASMLDPIMVNAYGSPMPLNQLATVTVPEARMLAVQVWDKSQVQAVDKAGQYAYRDRRVRKRDFRRLWIQRINAAVREASEHTMTYARFMDGLNKASIELDRKVLADIAVHDADAFKALVGQAQEALAAN